MDFSYNEEQTLFSDSLGRVLDDHCDDAKRRKTLAQTDEFHSETLWREISALGLLGLAFSEEHGGYGGSAIDVMVASIEFGKHLSLEPFLATAVLGGAALRLGGSAAQQEALIPQVIAGDLKLACAFGEPQSRYDLFDVETRAEFQGGEYHLQGQKAVVIGGDSADKLVVSARTSGGESDKSGISLFLIDTTANGVGIRPYRLVDGRGAAEVYLDQVQVPAAAMLGEEGAAWPVIGQVVDLGTAALCAEAVGPCRWPTTSPINTLENANSSGGPSGRFRFCSIGWWIC